MVSTNGRDAKSHLAPAYLADEVHLMVNSDVCRRLQSTSSSSLLVRRTRLSTTSIIIIINIFNVA